MRFRRLLLFLLVIVLGAGLGLAYGWMINPSPYANLKAETLRYDYKADYVLMIAEVYRKDKNLASAVRCLTLLESATPEEQVGRALVAARDLAYPQSDVETIAYLAAALQTTPPEAANP